MRILLAVLMTVPAWAQAPATGPDQTAAPAASNVSSQTPSDAGGKTAGATAEESPVPSTEPWFTGSVDMGFRWLTGPQGSVATYRSIIDLDQGPRLFGLDFTIKDPKRRLFDRIDARGYAWGDPYNTAHVEVQKSSVYDFNFDYRNIWYFNELPSFANPLAPNGIDEQSFDVRRHMLDASLDLRPGKRIIPYLDFSHNSEFGHGIATWLQDASNEYAVPVLPRESTNNYRGGVRFEYNKWHVTLEEGGTTFKDDEQASANYFNPGDRGTPFIGQNLALTNLQQIYGIRGDSTYSRGLFTATPTTWLSLSGQFMFSQPTIDVNYAELAAGNLAGTVASSLLFYTSELGLATGAAKQPHVSGNAGFDLRPLKRLRIVESWMTDRYHDAAFGLFSQVFSTGKSAAVTAANAMPNEQVVNFNQQQLDVIYDLSSKLTLRGGWRYVWGDSTVLAGTLSQTGNFASGQLKRQIGLAGVTFRPTQKLSMNLDYEGSSSDDIYFRTSLNDYHKARGQVRYQATGSLSLQGNFMVLNNQNPSPDIKYDFQTRDTSLALYWTPNGGKRVTFTGEYDRYTLRSDIGYRDLPFLTSAVSTYHENAHIASSSTEVALPEYAGMTPKLTFGGSLFVSSLSRPTRFYEPMGRLTLPVQKNISLYAEWQWYGMGEPFYLYEGFRTHAFITGVRITK